MFDWKSDIIKMHQDGCTDSDVEDYCAEHAKDVQEKEVWAFLYSLNAPDCCKGCVHTGCYRTMYPCTVCSRPKSIDYYQAKTN